MARSARIVCCFLGCDERPFNPLLASLPPTIHLSGAGNEASSGWLATLLNIAVRESGSARAGRDNILARMSELMFVEAIRRHIETLPPRRPDGSPACAIRSSDRRWPRFTASR